MQESSILTMTASTLMCTPNIYCFHVIHFYVLLIKRLLLTDVFYIFLGGGGQIKTYMLVNNHLRGVAGKQREWLPAVLNPGYF